MASAPTASRSTFTLTPRDSAPRSAAAMSSRRLAVLEDVLGVVDRPAGAADRGNLGGKISSPFSRISTRLPPTTVVPVYAPRVAANARLLDVERRQLEVRRDTRAARGDREQQSEAHPCEPAARRCIGSSPVSESLVSTISRSTAGYQDRRIRVLPARARGRPVGSTGPSSNIYRPPRSGRRDDPARVADPKIPGSPGVSTPVAPRPALARSLLVRVGRTSRYPV